MDILSVNKSLHDLIAKLKAKVTILGKTLLTHVPKKTLDPNNYLQKKPMAI